MYFRVQETHLDTGPRYRETMSSALLQQKNILCTVLHIHQTSNNICKGENIQYHQQMQRAVEKKVARI